ncbi:aldo/keto reductase [Falsarthrobacter nasiphocae]|uniref:2,5-diketo-D-gluconate reductase A n=1 Tax=Falsarthrobacter nasiphocae TaxID=189863 RepID=A0AAE3YE91_9MICC|nr:aldo/keto reductase [Falsarthrobacter nasiphocae]MDR6891779.1 2,5-diketo-D-gluconate reductase A [Falsarthrobacter nasiphocae]
MTNTVKDLKFSDSRSIPQLGFGVWQVEDDGAEAAVTKALEVGYRHIDTAKVYENEAGVGRAVAASSIPREELFITTKLWNADQGYEAAIAALEASLERLGLEYVDLYLIHWLQPKQGLYVETWKALIELQKRGLVKSIGVSNFTADALREITDVTGVAPVINQVETHPYFNQAALREVERDMGILHESWSPLGQGKELLEDPVLVKIAERLGATVAQVVIAWHLQLGNVVIPKSVTPSRIEENFAATGVTLTDEDMDAINGLDKGEDGRIGPDPAVSDFA